MAKNPNFKRIERINTVEDQRNLADKDAITLAERVKKFTASKKQDQARAKEFRQNTVGTLGEVTERFIQEGFSEDDAFNEAKNIIDEVDSDPNFQAKGGFMGMINTKTKFTVGEKNKRELVSVRPKKSIFDQQMDFFSTPKGKGKKTNNIFEVGF